MTANTWLKALLYLISEEIQVREDPHSPLSSISPLITYWHADKAPTPSTVPNKSISSRPRQSLTLHPPHAHL